jgi:hypothetical protein
MVESQFEGIDLRKTARLCKVFNRFASANLARPAPTASVSAAAN